MLSYQKLSWHCMDDPHNPCRLPDNFIVQKKCFEMCLKCSPLSQVPLCSNHQVSYTKSNLKHLAISTSKDFMIHPVLTEKRVSLLVTGTLGHSVLYLSQSQVFYYDVAIEVCQKRRGPRPAASISGVTPSLLLSRLLVVVHYFYTRIQ